MNITIFPPIACSEKGRRANNQDSIFPLQSNSSDKLFLVCDGVGGMSQGSDASRIVCEAFGSALADKAFSDQKTIDDALLQAETVLNAFAKTQTLPKGMATTLTLLHLHSQGATIAHIGDSRVYQIREGKVVFKTHDHSWVNELVSQGVITPEQARTHPQRNVIARAIQAEKPAKADVTLRTDLQPNDYFLMCSDGILESCAEESLLLLLQQNRSNEQKISMIQEQCRLHSKDNFSCYLIQIQSVTQESYPQMARVQTIPDEEPTVRIKPIQAVWEARTSTQPQPISEEQPLLHTPSVPQDQTTKRLERSPQDATTERMPQKATVERIQETVERIQETVQPEVNFSIVSSQNQNRPLPTKPQGIFLWILLGLLFCLVAAIWWLNIN
jgi:serine/threonine protein phosphatase PrpC